MKKALLLIDIQNDFLPGGNLAVPGGDAIIPAANKAMNAFDLVVASQDKHPADHLSFASQHQEKIPGEMISLNSLDQILWPDHCVQGTKGAELAHSLNAEKINRVFDKGTDREIDSYSSFFDNGHVKATGLETYLRDNNVNEITITGLATDYCVKFTVLDALELGFTVNIIQEGVRGVDLNKGDSEKAMEEMITAGAKVISINDIVEIT